MHNKCPGIQLFKKNTLTKWMLHFYNWKLTGTLCSLSHPDQEKKYAAQKEKSLLTLMELSLKGRIEEQRKKKKYAEAYIKLVDYLNEPSTSNKREDHVVYSFQNHNQSQTPSPTFLLHA